MNGLAKDIATTLESEIDGLRKLIDRSMDGLAKDLGIEADDDRPGGDRNRSEAVKVLAAQLIASGHTPEEAEQRLIDEFGVEDPESRPGSDRLQEAALPARESKRSHDGPAELTALRLHHRHRRHLASTTSS